MYLTHDYPRFSLLIHPPQDLEDDIAKLEANSELSSADKLRLASLKAELVKINKKKEEYVQEHPEHRKLVFKSRRPAEGEHEVGNENPTPKTRNLYKKNGQLRHPERSVYYHPIMNPFGVPPPGMPYVERGESFICILITGGLLLWMQLFYRTK